MEMILGLVVVWVLMKAFSVNQTNIVSVHVELKTTDTDNSKLFNRQANMLKIEILNIYSNRYCVNRRELIVDKLRHLYLYEDPGDFLETYNHIHKFLFNHCQYT